MFNLAELRKNRTSDFSQIANALKKTSQYEKDDEGFFKLERDKAGNGSAVIRFLPKHSADALPWVAIYSHGFKGPTGRWYIENSLSTLGQEDPVADSNRKLWQTGLDSDKELAKTRKRRLNYVSNVLIVSYPTNPALEGTVMRFRYGKKIHDKLTAKSAPDFPDEVACNPFDPELGANFKLRMKQVEGYPNYDSSAFADPSPIGSSDEEILEILNKITPLNELVAPSKFKTYAELQAKFDSVVNGSTSSTKTAEEVSDALMSSAVAARPPGKVVTAPQPASVANDTDDIEDYFRSISD